MTLKAEVQNDISRVFLNTDEFADTVTYRRDRKPDRNISAIIENQEWQQVVDETGEYYLREVDVVINTVNDVVGVVSPGEDDKVVIEGEIWGIRRVHKDGIGSATLTLERREQKERGARRRRN